MVPTKFVIAMLICTSSFREVRVNDLEASQDIAAQIALFHIADHVELFTGRGGGVDLRFATPTTFIFAPFAADSSTFGVLILQRSILPARRRDAGMIVS